MAYFISIGTGPGMGFETALRFAKEGFTPVLCARRTDKLKEMAKQLAAQCGVKAEIYPLDVTDDAALAALAAHYSEAEVVHFNAAAVRALSLEQGSGSDFDQDLACGLNAAVKTVKLFAAPMTSRGHGTILLTGGGLAHHPHPAYLSLSLAKAGLLALSQALAEPLKAQGVHLTVLTVNQSVAPQSKAACEEAELFYKLFKQTPDEWTAELDDGVAWGA